MGRMEIAAILMAHNVLFFSHITFLFFPQMNILYYLLTWHHRVPSYLGNRFLRIKFEHFDFLISNTWCHTAASIHAIQLYGTYQGNSLRGTVNWLIAEMSKDAS